MKKYNLILLLLLFVFVSCKKEKADEIIIPAVPEFTTCDCTVSGPGKVLPEEYIKGNINGVMVCAEMKGYFQDSYDNMLLYGTIKRPTGNTYYDNLHMIRYTKDGNFQIAIFMENTHLLTKQFPYELPRSNPEYCEIGQLQLNNQHKLTPDMCSFCHDNYWHYNGSFFGNQLKLTADKFENGFFEGRFEGSIRTGSGKYATIKEGRFRIRLAVIQRDIIIP